MQGNTRKVMTSSCLKLKCLNNSLNCVGLPRRACVCVCVCVFACVSGCVRECV